MTDRDTLPPHRGPDGLYVYLDSHDVREIDSAAGRGQRGDTIARLLRAGAVGALVLVESVEGTRQDRARVERVCAALTDAALSPILFSFPSVLGSLTHAIDHLRACRDATGCAVQWDVEPQAHDGRVVHWSQAGLDRLLAADPAASITSTRIELPRLDPRGREVWLQLEQQTSTDTLDRALRTAPDAVLVTGVFDQPGDPRTLDEVRRDLARCTPQARRVGRHAVWSAHTLGDAEADVHREWALATWPSAA